MHTDLSKLRYEQAVINSVKRFIELGVQRICLDAINIPYFNMTHLFSARIFGTTHSIGASG